MRTLYKNIIDWLDESINCANDAINEDNEKKYYKSVGAIKTLGRVLEETGHKVTINTQHTGTKGYWKVTSRAISDDAVSTIVFYRNKSLIDQAMDYIKEYYEQEFGDTYETNYPIEDLSNISLAYTTTEDGEMEIQVTADLKNLHIKTIVNGHELRKEKFKDIRDMIDNGLKNLNFSHLTYLSPADILLVEAQELLENNKKGEQEC